MAKVFEVSRSGYYQYVKTGGGISKHRDAELLGKIKIIHVANREIYGSPRIYRELKAQGKKVGRNRVGRIMRENNIVGKKRRLFKRTTKQDSKLPIAANVIAKDFTAKK